MKRKIVLTVAMLIVITAGIEPEIKAWLGKLGFSVQQKGKQDVQNNKLMLDIFYAIQLRWKK